MEKNVFQIREIKDGMVVLEREDLLTVNVPINCIVMKGFETLRVGGFVQANQNMTFNCVDKNQK